MKPVGKLDLNQMEASSSPRRLLRRLHTVMAGPGSAQARLDKVASVIATDMVAEVCSVYLVRAGQMLELFATQGLKKEAVHMTKLAMGEGLVGHIAETGLPLNLPEAAEHPKYVYRPETGEEIYHSLLGVPIVHSGNVAGVLVVQNRTRRTYTEEEVEVLQTVAMVLAEIIASGELVDPREIVHATTAPDQPAHFEGLALVDGVAAGRAVFHEPRIEITMLVADDVEEEKHRLEAGLETLRESIDQLMSASDIGGGEHRDVLDAYKMFAYDRGWQKRIFDAVESGLTAEAAIERVQQNIRARMLSTEDPYLRERLHDFEDLAYRLIRILLASGEDGGRSALDQPSVVVARNMGPAEILDYRSENLKAVILEEGSPTSHVTIIARAMGIPMIGRMQGLLAEVDEGDKIIVDADAGGVFIRPDDEVAESYLENIALREARAAEYLAQRDLPSVSKDGVHVHLHINAGLMIDLPSLDATGAEGIGLFRTEFQFLVSDTLPSLKAQKQIYSEVLDAAGDRPVVFRTLDIGGDKHVPFLPREHEENPALGWRAIRVALDRPALLRYQIRALLQAAEGRRLSIMFPLVADVSEFVRASELVKREERRLERLGEGLPAEIRVGTMLEVPALAWQLDSLLPEIDFLSIGTNDLLQYFFASDRSHPKLVERYDFLSPAVLSFIRSVVKACNRAEVPVTLCGEMGSRPLEALALVGLGLRQLSISPSAIGPVRVMIRALDIGDLESRLLPLLNSPEHSLRENLKAYAHEHAIPI
ncbi:MAG: phosphoenolpyruvate--protein phosphotransferase [Sphingomonadales bacterium]|nr:phosphoenolpyruvate--protein phosphotransferase [Sphingomonadales bacterium]